MSEQHCEEPNIRDAAEVGTAVAVGVKIARELVTIANTSDMGDLREDATGEAIRRLIAETPHGLHGAALVEAVKMLSIALAAFSDELQGRNPPDPTLAPLAASEVPRQAAAEAGSPLDTLKALALRNIDGLEHVQDWLGGCEVADNLPDGALEYLDRIRQRQYEALAEHMPVSRDELLGELRVLPRETYAYDDGSPVMERLTSPPGITSVYYPRYDGDRDEFEARHREAAEQVATCMAETAARAMIHDLEAWRRALPEPGREGMGGDEA